MTKFDHKHHTRQALLAAGWTDLEYNQQGRLWGTTPRGARFQIAPMLTQDHTTALAYLLDVGTLVSVHFSDVAVTVIAGGTTIVDLADCDGRPLLALARAAALRLGEMGE